MTTENLIPRPNDGVNAHVREEALKAVEALLSRVEAGASARDVELEVWKHVLGIGRVLLTYGLSLVARRATEEDLARRGLGWKDVHVRTDRDYWKTLNTTFGAVCFMLFAYRDRTSGVAAVTRAPARDEAFALHRRCESSEVLLEWETRLGSELPFRRADEGLAFFSHGVAQVEDTTIARHLVHVGTMIEREWLYRTLPDLRKILAERATRDAESGEPILYASCDAHALRRYVDETWDAQWKMANGLRLWCIDRVSGSTIHIGGEYTWGDCHQVRAIFAALIASGHLPVDGDYGDGLKSRLVFVTDGMPWFEDYIFPQFPHAVRIVDAYHLKERLATYANERFGRGTKAARAWYERALTALFGKRADEPKRPRKRKGQRERNLVTPDRAPSRPDENVAGGAALMRLLEGDDVRLLKGDDAADASVERHQLLLRFVEHRADNINYPLFRWLGFQIGSGAMESLHRSGSQLRLKIPGGRWLAETSQAIFNVRMMLLAGRWSAFWNRPGLSSQLTHEFNTSRPAEAA